MNEGEFEGRVALVTGGSLGIGRAVVERLAAAGASVILCGADEDSVHASEDDLRAAGLKVTGIRADVTVAAEAQGLVTCAVKYYGGLDIVVNSAGIQRYGTVEETSEAEWDRVLDVNLKGIFLVCRAAIPELRRRGGGAVVNVASVQATATQAGVAAYTASKGGILALTRAMAVDHAVDGIRVTVVSPGSVDTPMLRWAADQFRGERSADDLVAEWGRSHPLGRVAAAAEVAELVALPGQPAGGLRHRVRTPDRRRTARPPRRGPPGAAVAEGIRGVSDHLCCSVGPPRASTMKQSVACTVLVGMGSQAPDIARTTLRNRTSPCE